MRLSTESAAPPAGILAQHALIQSDLACILAHALAERAAGRGPLTERLGLSPAALRALAGRYFPGAHLPDLDGPAPRATEDQEKLALLLLWRGGDLSEESRWLAAILARRAMEGRHLWEDLGLPGRPALGALIARHFPRIHAANTQNMRWKKFFYRQICSDAAFALCLSPSCDDCPEKSGCFAPA